jgi:hypothetical protein
VLTAIRADLNAAAASVALVRILRTIRGADSVDGFVLKIGAEWLLLQNLDPGMFLDGHVSLRVRDIRRVKPLPSGSFAARALQHYGDRPRMPGRVDLSSTRTLIESSSRRFPLVTIHVERRDPSVCYIGVPVDVNSRTLRLREITPDADWENEPRSYRLADVTRVDIGGRYERALLAVGGRPTKATGPQRSS